MKTLNSLLSHKLMALVRMDSKDKGQELADVLVAAGIKVIEITLTTPGAEKIIEKLAKNKELTVGAGTVLSTKDVKKAENAGAKFIVWLTSQIDNNGIGNGQSLIILTPTLMLSNFF